jgi:glycosyltransferase involved in cell wall biosynthesis
MKVLYDHEIFWMQKTGGISRYFSCLIEELIKKSNINPIVSVPFFRNVYLRNINKEYLKGFYLENKPAFCGNLINYYNNFKTLKNISKEKPDIIHLTYYSNYLINNNKDYVLTVYDLFHETFNNNNKFRPKTLALQNAKHIICISQKTKKDLINLYGVDETKISVIYLGGDHILTNNIELNKNLEPFLLYVGSRARKYKGFNFFLESFAKSIKLKKDLKLVIFGDEVVSKQEYNLIKNNKLEDRIVFDSGDDAKLLSYYKNARAFVFPSTFEGFGLPLVEAMHSGCPVICNSIEVFKEIGSDSVEFFDYNNSDSLINSIEKVVYDSAYSSDLIKKGLNRAKKITWRHCSQLTENVYKHILQSK